MKQICKRSCSLLLVLAVLLALCPTSLLTVSAASTNQGTRHEVCEELSSKATAYYTGNYTYDAMASLTPGNESCLDTVDSAMYQRLQALMESTMTKSVSYDSLIDYWPDTDCTASSSQAQLFYSDEPSSSFNREHVWPKSRASFYQNGGGCDLHHLRPTNSSVNSTRNNYTMGNVRELYSSYSTHYYDDNPVLYYVGGYKEDGKSLGMVEVNDNIKGDVARVLLYVYVRWEEPNLFETDPNPYEPSGDENTGWKVIMDLETLLQWCEMDPVDTWEMSRNDSIQGVQGNRNVFIDFPEFAWLLFGQEIPANMTTPSGNGSVNFEINAISSNTSHGTVSVSGRTITAYPKTGYYAAGYTVLSGTATVTQNGNTFTVDAETGCAIRINFAAKTAVTVSFNGAADAISGYAGDEITLPHIANPDGYRFVGWVEAPVADTTEKPAFYAAGSSYTPTRSITLYALYQHSDGPNPVEGWTRVMSTDELISGTELIIASTANGVAAGNIATTYLADVVATFSADFSILEAPDETVEIFTLGGEDGAWTLTNADGQLLGAAAAKKLGWGVGTTTWNISVSNGDASIYSGNSSYGRILYNNNSPRFTTYTNTPSAMLSLPQLYQRGGGTIFYTTELVSCEHSTSTYHKAVAASCTTAGNSAYYTCNDCGRLFSDAACSNQITLADTVIAAFGHTAGKYSSDETYHWHLCATCGADLDDSEKHAWDDGVVTVQPTETQTGLRVYTCTVCSATKNESIDALGAKLYLSFTVPAGLTAPAALSGYKGDIVTLPDYSAVPDEDYTFVGWISETVKDSTSVGSYYKAGQSYILSADASLKALFTYCQITDPDGTGKWMLVESDSELKAGMQLVLTSNTKGVTAGAHNSGYLDEVDSVFSDDLSVLETLGDGTVKLVLGGEAGAWTLTNEEGQLLGATANKNVKWDSGTTTWKITINEGAATIQNTNSSYGRFLYNVSATRFTTYTSATSTSMLLPQLYAFDGKATITYYTTECGAASTEPTVDENITIYHTLDLASDISITFAVPKTALANYDSYYLECILPEYEGNTQTGTTTVKVEPVLNGNYYYFTLTGITAVRMGDMVNAVLHMSKGGVEYISKTDSYSVATYAYAMMAKSTDVYMLTLCADLLRYGAEAQSYKKYRTDSLVDAAMTDAQRAYLSDTDALTFTATDSYLGDLESPTITWVGKTLDLGSKVGMKFVFNAKSYSGDVTDLSMKVSYTGSTGELKTVTLTGIEVYSSANSYYSFTFYGLLASELRTIVDVAIYEGETQLSETLRYSAETYASKTGGTALEALSKALFAYSDSAKAFFAK